MTTANLETAIAIRYMPRPSSAEGLRGASNGSGGRLVNPALAVFGVLAALALVNEAALLTIDQRIQTAVIEARTAWLDEAMKMLTFLGTRWITGAVTLGVVAWSAVTGRGRRYAAVMVVAFLANPVVEVALKELVGRPRPDLARLLAGNGPSFPSGHVLAAFGTYGMLPFFVRRQTRSRPIATGFAAVSAAVIAVVAVSRVYLDVHWTTDVVAGLMAGVVLVVWFDRRASAATRPGSPTVAHPESALAPAGRRGI